MTRVVARRRFTVAEYHRMGEVGILTEDDRVELIRGEILSEDTEPEPDVQVLRPATVPHKYREVRADDALLVIEAGVSSLAYDRSTKLRLYAEAGIPEYWVVDCVAESIEIYRTPHAEEYRDVARLAAPTDTVALRAFPDVVLTLAEIFA